MTQIYGDESWFNEDAKFYKTTTITNLKVTNGAEIVGDVEVDGRVQKTQYEPGEIIETISTTCDGSTITVKSGSYTVSDVTAEQVGTTTYATVDGSEISYTPPTGTKRVHYRFWYHFDVTENSGISHHIMQIMDQMFMEVRTTLHQTMHKATGIMDVFQYQLNIRLIVQQILMMSIMENLNLGLNQKH